MTGAGLPSSLCLPCCLRTTRPVKMVAEVYVLSASKPAHATRPDLAVSCRACGGGSGAFLLAADASGEGLQFAGYGPGHPGGTDLPTRPSACPCGSSANKGQSQGGFQALSNSSGGRAIRRPSSAP